MALQRSPHCRVAGTGTGSEATRGALLLNHGCTDCGKRGLEHGRPWLTWRRRPSDLGVVGELGLPRLSLKVGVVLSAGRYRGDASSHG